MKIDVSGDISMKRCNDSDMVHGRRVFHFMNICIIVYTIMRKVDHVVLCHDAVMLVLTAKVAVEAV